MTFDTAIARALRGGRRPAVDFANDLLQQLAQGSLIWLDAAGVGYLELEQPAAAVYDQAYFDRYAAQAQSGIGPALMAARVALLQRHVGDLALTAGDGVLDVGIGSGAFIEAMWASAYPCRGFDINPAGVAWLQARGLFRELDAPAISVPDCADPERLVWIERAAAHRVVTFWDCLEHMRRPDLALAACADWAFVALPIFTGPEQARASRHFRPTEHAWYFTRAGFVRFAEQQGFRLVDLVATETALGREGIETFVLRRRP